MTSLSLGAKNDSLEDILRKHLSPALSGKGWDALLAALATGDKYKAELAEVGFDQLFKSSASGVYLDRRAADDGMARPPNIGISDEVFRKLTIKTTARKQVVQVILEILEAYYGSEATRAYATAQISEPYALSDGDTLILNIDGKKAYTVTFSADDFESIGVATAVEVATILTRELRRLGSTGYAVAFNDPETGVAFVRVFSGALGLTGSVQVLGGRSQNSFQFPFKVHSPGAGPQAGTSWTITPSTGTNGIPPGRVRVSWVGGATPLLNDVNVGDYVNVYGGAFFAENRGAFPVLDVTSTYFEIENIGALPQVGVAQTQSMDVAFFRPERRTIQSSGRMATAVQGDPSTLEIILPATTQAVERGPKRAAYVHGATIHSVSYGTRDANGLVYVVTTAPHGLIPGQWVSIDGVTPRGFDQLPYFFPVDEDLLAPVGYGTTATKLADGRILIVGGETGDSAYIFQEGVGFVTVAAPNISRMAHAAVLLKNGRVLVAGGWSDLSGAEIYDPSSNTWTTTGYTFWEYESARMTLLNDGRALIVGSQGAEIYNPATGTWSQTQGLGEDHGGGSLIKLDDGRVLVAGGSNEIAEIYNPVTNSWSSASGFGDGISRFSQAVRIDVGYGYRILVMGGTNSIGDVTNECWLFDPATLTWTQAASMLHSRYLHSAAVLKDGRVLVCNGANPGQLWAEIYDPINNKWTAISDTSYARCNGDAILLNSGNVFLSAGVPADGYSGASPISAEIFSPATEVRTAGGLNGLFRIENIYTSLSLTFRTPDFPYETYFETGRVTPVRALNGGTDGPFIYDTLGGAAITGIESTLSQNLIDGQSYNVIAVADASQFPDEEGWLCFGFGTSSAVFPVKYLGRISDQHLLLDPSYVFKRKLPINTTVTLMKQRGVWEPDAPESVGSFYLTASASGRVAASDTVDELVAAGVKVVKTVIYPSDVGLGNEGYPTSGSTKISDKISVWGSDNLDSEVATAREE